MNVYLRQSLAEHLPMTMTLLACGHADCGRSFADKTALDDHAAALHSFNDSRDLVQAALRTRYIDPSSGRSPYVYIEDMATDWVIFEVHGLLFRQEYSIGDANAVTLAGAPQRVVRKTVYEPVGTVAEA